MKSKTYRPKRSWRAELLPLLAVIASPVLLGLVFPVDALEFLPAAEGVRPEVAGAAFVTLSPEVEEKAVASARGSWQVGLERDRSLRIEMFAEPLPARSGAPVIGLEHRSPASAAAVSGYASDPVAESLASPPAGKLPSAAATAAKTEAFPREDLLKLE